MSGNQVSWHEYFMGMAKQASTRSKDPSTKVGAVIVDSSKNIVSTGYNGFPAGCNEDYMTFERPLKYNLIVHAEMNAIMRAQKQDLSDCTMYVTEAPCDNCLKHVLSKQIRTIYYNSASVMCNRGDRNQKEAIKLLLKATGALCVNINNGITYEKELEESDC